MNFRERARQLWKDVKDGVPGAYDKALKLTRIERRAPLPRSTKPIQRSYIKRRATKRSASLAEHRNKAINYYFDHHPAFETQGGWAKCQICRGLMHRKETTWAHKWRRHHNRHLPNETMAAHLKCHEWMDARPDREAAAKGSPANCRDGGFITWSYEQEASLRTWLRDGVDKIYLTTPDPHCKIQQAKNGKEDL